MIEEFRGEVCELLRSLGHPDLAEEISDMSANWVEYMMHVSGNNAGACALLISADA